MKTNHYNILALLATSVAFPAFAQDKQPEAAKPPVPSPHGERGQLRIQRMMEMVQEKPQEQAPAWRIGVGVAPIEKDLRMHLNIPEDSGVMVKEVMPNGPAAKAKIKENDIILRANGQPVANMDQLREIVNAAGKNHAPIRLMVIQEGKHCEVTIANDMPKPEQAPKREMQAPQNRGSVMVGPQMIEELRGQVARLSQQVEKQQREMEEMKKIMRERFKDVERRENAAEKKDKKPNE
jgi:membrane-associated protease RseP (regulator of RpoE activity)